MLQTSKDNWNANLYDQSHSFVSKYGNSLVELLAPKEGERILDLGCGTGDLAKKLDGQGVTVVGIDKSENMIAQAKNKYPTIHFSVKDATNLEYMNEFDAVFSNATLHWVKPPSKALACIYESLKIGGRFVAEFGGKGNVQLITNEIVKQITNEGIEFQSEHNPWYYPSIGQYAALMEEIGFRVTFAQHYDRPTPLEGEDGLSNWIHMFGSQFFTGIEEEQRLKIIAKIEDALRPVLYQEGAWVADYKRIRVIGVKE